MVLPKTLAGKDVSAASSSSRAYRKHQDFFWGAAAMFYTSPLPSSPLFSEKLQQYSTWYRALKG